MIVELFSEHSDPSSDSDDIKSFPMIPWLQQELVEFAQTKLLESVELQQFLGDKEIEFLRKYIDLLEPSNQGSNNANDLEQLIDHLELSSSERSTALEGARNRLNGLHVQRESLGRREQKALDSFSSCSQIRIQRSGSGSASSLCSISWSISLRKIHCILEKLTKVTDSIESNFWFSEIGTLLEKLSENEKTIMMKGAMGSVELMVFLLGKQEQLVVRFFDRRDCSMEELKKNFELLNRMLEKVTPTTSSSTHSTILSIITSQFIRMLEHRELRSSHLELIISYLERAPRCADFDLVFTILESKKTIMDGSLQSRLARLLEPSDPTPLLPVYSSMSSASSTSNLSSISSSSRIKNFTVIEHTHQNSHQSSEEDVRRQVEEQTRRQHQEEQERIVRMERIAEETRRKVTEELRIQDETRRQVEQEHRLRAEQERLQREHQKQLDAEKKAQEKKRRQALKCTFLTNVTLIRHETGEHFDESVLDGKLIGLYFSAHWCPPSLTFTPVLRQFYQHVEEDMEVVFASWDRNPAEMNYYMANYHGDWLHFQLGDHVAKMLGEQLSVESIPTLIVLKPNGQVLTMKGREEVQAATNPKQLVMHWKSFL